jgi:tRNA(fMet)-specific endonuclease VapC
MKVLLDSNAYSDWRRAKAWGHTISTATVVYLPTIVLGELHAGFRMGMAKKENVASLAAFLNAEPVEVVGPTERTAEIYGEFVTQLRKQGTPIPTNDIWISALAYEFKAMLVTKDAHFRNLPQVALAVEKS